MLYLVRHGRTAANASGLLLGRLDPELDDTGRVQAGALAAAVVAASPRVARVITSPLTRTRQTAAAIADAVGSDVEVEVDERWIELDYGELDGTPLTDVPRATWARWRSDVAFAPPGGESLVDLRRRVSPALDELAAREAADGDAAGDVVVVSHVSPIKAGVAWTLGVGDEVTWRMFLAPASITRVRLGGPSLVGFNDVTHLPT